MRQETAAEFLVDDGTATMIGANVQFNTARRSGGGMFINGFLQTFSSTITDNDALAFPNVFDDWARTNRMD